MRPVNLDMVYTAAAFHDVGLVNGRKYHHIDSRKILESDPFVASHFSQRQIAMMGRAVEDHRASNSHKPRNRYGLIVAEADRMIDPETIVRRTIQYGLANYPELDRENQYRRALSHITEKYGDGGYLKIWIPWSDNARRLKELQSLLLDHERFRCMFDMIYARETRH